MCVAEFASNPKKKLSPLGIPSMCPEVNDAAERPAKRPRHGRVEFFAQLTAHVMDEFATMVSARPTPPPRADRYRESEV